MDEYVLSAHDPIALLLHAYRVVVVLEHADLETLVEDTDLVQHSSPHRCAAKREGFDIEGHAGEILGTPFRDRVELIQPGVGHVDLRLVAGSVRYRTQKTDRGITFKVTDEAAQPAARHNRVVI